MPVHSPDADSGQPRDGVVLQGVIAREQLRTCNFKHSSPVSGGIGAKVGRLPALPAGTGGSGAS